MRRLVIFDTHPIQYRTPVFQALAQREPETRVYFFNAEFNARKWWFYEMGKTPRQVWGRTLDRGFANHVLDLDRLPLWAKWKRLVTVLERERPDAVAIYGYYLPEHWMLRVACARRKIPVIFIGETFAPSRSAWRGKLKAPLLRAFFRGVAQFIAIGTDAGTPDSLAHANQVVNAKPPRF
jgi:hypothetical protein